MYSRCWVCMWNGIFGYEVLIIVDLLFDFFFFLIFNLSFMEKLRNCKKFKFLVYSVLLFYYWIILVVIFCLFLIEKVFILFYNFYCKYIKVGDVIFNRCCWCFFVEFERICNCLWYGILCSGE